MTQPTMQAYAVTLVFADGSIFSNITTSHAREVALAASVQAAARDNPAVPDLTGFSVIDLPVERLRSILRQIEAEQLRSTLRKIGGQPGRVLNFPAGPTDGDPA
jgi:hypothetical protein